MTLRVGTAVVDITPPPGSLMACFPRKPERTARRAEGAHDPLQAKVLCLADGSETVALCACDLTLLNAADVNRIRATVGGDVSAMRGARLIFTATHTHSASETAYLFGNTPDDPWIEEMDRRIAAAVVRAHEAMQPARMAVGRTRAELAHNRRVRRTDGAMGMAYDFRAGVTVGPSDPEVIVLRFDDERGRALALVYNFAAHALTVGPRNLLYTADFPGVANARIEERLPGATALFLNGAAGDQHPRQSMREGFEVMREVGELVAETVLAAAADASETACPQLAFATDLLHFPNRADNALQVEVEISCVRLGPVAMAFVPGEPFVEFQLRFKEAVAPAVGLFAGYANGTVGYMPTTEAYAEGGYGVALCTSDPPELCRTALPPGAGEVILRRLLEIRNDLC